MSFVWHHHIKHSNANVKSFSIIAICFLGIILHREGFSLKSELALHGGVQILVAT